MLENYLTLLEIGDSIRKWRKGTKPPRSGIDRVFMLLISAMAFALVGFSKQMIDGLNYAFFGIAAFLLLYPLYWLFKPKKKWDDQLSLLMEHYQPVDLPALVKLKKAILEHDTLRLEDAESWLTQEMSANQGIADVAGSKAGEKYHFLYDKPLTGKGKGAPLKQEQ